MADDLNFCPSCGKPLAPAQGGAAAGNDAPVECPCGWSFRDPPRLVVAAIVELGETIILVRNRSWPDSSYGLPAGYLEKGETPEDGVLRKVKEEVGLTGEVVEIVGAYPNLSRNQVFLTYHVTAHGHVVAGKDIAGVKQVPIGELRIAPLATGLAVRDWLRVRRERQHPAGA